LGGEHRPGREPKLWVDDRHPIFRRGLVSWLTTDGFRITGESGGFNPAPEPSSFDVLLFDADGSSLTKALQLFRDCLLVALFTAPSERQLIDAIDGGVAAILLRKDITPRGMASSIRAVAHGKTALPSDLVPRLLAAASARTSTAQRAGLSDREVDVLRLLASGRNTKEMADQLCYSERTVKNIVHDVLVKMNCRNRTHAVGTATRQGLI